MISCPVGVFWMLSFLFCLFSMIIGGEEISVMNYGRFLEKLILRLNWNTRSSNYSIVDLCCVLELEFSLARVCKTNEIEQRMLNLHSELRTIGFKERDFMARLKPISNFITSFRNSKTPRLGGYKFLSPNFLLS